MSKGILVFIIFTTWTILTIIIAEYARKRQEKVSSDYFLGNRSLGSIVMFFTLLASMFSGGTFIGYTGAGYRMGLQWAGTFTIAMTATVSFFAVVGPRIWQVGHDLNLITPSDFYEARYPSNKKIMKLIVAILTLVAVTPYLLMQFLAIGHLFAGLVGKVNFLGISSYTWGIVWLLVFMIFLVVRGGFKGVAFLDSIQGFVMLIFILISLIVVYKYQGSPSNVISTIQNNVKESAFLLGAPDGATLGKVWFSLIALIFLGELGYPHAFQRLYAAQSKANLKRTLTMTIIGSFFLAIIAAWVGFAGRGIWVNLPKMQSEEIYPMLLDKIFADPFIPIILLSGAVAAIMSTFDSALLSISSIVTEDLYKGFVNPEVREEKLVKIGKISTIVIAILIAILALKPPETILAITILKFSYLAQLAFPALLGVYWKRINTNIAITAVITGVVVATVLLLGFGKYIGSLHAGLYAVGVNLLVCVIGGLMSNKKLPEAVSKHFFEEVA